MRKDRLEKLILALEGVKPKDFDMTRYIHACGTPACVMGYFASRTDLQRKFYIEKREDRPRVLYRGTDDIVDYGDFETLAYFGITLDQADYLFGDCMGNTDRGPGQMRQRIRRFIDKDGDVILPAY